MWKTQDLSVYVGGMEEFNQPIRPGHLNDSSFHKPVNQGMGWNQMKNILTLYGYVTGMEEAQPVKDLLLTQV